MDKNLVFSGIRAIFFAGLALSSAAPAPQQAQACSSCWWTFISGTQIASCQAGNYFSCWTNGRDCEVFGENCQPG
jgi:hypothetical protein